MVPATSGSNLSCAQGEKVKLRVSYGGAFIMVSATVVHLRCALTPAHDHHRSQEALRRD